MDRAKSPPVSALAGTGSVCAKRKVNGAGPRARVRVAGVGGEFPGLKLSPEKVFLLKVLLRRRGGGGAIFFP